MFKPFLHHLADTGKQAASSRPSAKRDSSPEERTEMKRRRETAQFFQYQQRLLTVGVPPKDARLLAFWHCLWLHINAYIQLNKEPTHIIYIYI